MKDILLNVIRYKLKLGQSKEEIITGMFHTMCDELNISKQQAMKFIRQQISAEYLSKVEMANRSTQVSTLVKTISDEFSSSTKPHSTKQSSQGRQSSRGILSLFNLNNLLSKKAS